MVFVLLHNHLGEVAPSCVFCPVLHCGAVLLEVSGAASLEFCVAGGFTSADVYQWRSASDNASVVPLFDK